MSLAPAPPSPNPPGRTVRLAGIGRRLIAAGLIALIFLATLGQVVRDRSIAWALLMDLPLWLLGGAALGFDLICRGRALRSARHRFALAVLGLATVAGATWQLTVPADSPAADGGSHPAQAVRPVSVLHWNVIWGGGRKRNPAGWAAIRRTIVAHRADIVILSEGAPDEWLDGMVADLGPTGARVQVENEPGARNWFKLVVATARPVRLVGRPPVRNGAAMAAEIEVEAAGGPTGKLRLLVVDGLSHPLIDRTPFLHDVAGLCRAAEAAGEPFDLVAGDFNSLARSVGFDALTAAGYGLASRSGWAWRGTFPSFLPVYDIDHVWVRRERWPVVRWDGFTDLASDHRGQVVRLGRAVDNR